MLAPQLGNIKLTPYTINGWGEEQIAQVEKPSLADYNVSLLIEIAMSFLKPAQSIAFSILGKIPEGDRILYKDFITVTKNAYNLNKKVVSVYTHTPTGNRWVDYVIAYQRRGTLFSYVGYFKYNNSYTSNWKNFGWVQLIKAPVYDDDTYLKQLAYALWVDGAGNPEIYDFEGGTVNNNNINM